MKLKFLSITTTALLFFTPTILSAQGAPDEEEDSTMTFEQLEFEEALIEMFGGDFLSETESENTTLLSGAGKTDKQQIDELMQSAKLLYSNIYDESSMRIENGDTTFTSSYLFNNCSESNIVREKGGEFIRYESIIYNSKDLDECALFYDAWKTKLSNELIAEFDMAEEENNYTVAYTLADKTDKSLTIYLMIRDTGNEYSTSLILRGNKDLLKRKANADLWDN